MEVYCKIYLVADMFSHLCKTLYMRHCVFRIFYLLDRRNNRILKCSVSFTKSHISHLKHIFYREFALNTCNLYMRIHSDFVTDFAAKHFINRAIVVFTLDVPHSLLNTAYCRKHNRTSAIKSAAVKCLDMMFYHKRVFADKIFFVFVDKAFYRFAVTFKYRLTPTNDICIGIHLKEHPSWFHVKKFEFCNFHSFSAFHSFLILIIQLNLFNKRQIFVIINRIIYTFFILIYVI